MGNIKSMYYIYILKWKRVADVDETDLITKDGRCLKIQLVGTFVIPLPMLVMELLLINSCLRLCDKRNLTNK